MANPAGYYTVRASVVGADLVASLYAVGGPMWVGGASIVCGLTVPAYAIIGTPIAPLYAMDGTRSGGLDSTSYFPPRMVPAGQAYSILWVNAAASTASMTVQLVNDPSAPGGR